MATQTTLSDQTMQKAMRLADQVHTFARGRSKVDGSRFVIIPSSDAPETSGHYTNLHTCSCLGYARRGICSHVEALRIVQRRRDKETAAQFICSQCGKAAVGRSRLCPVHLDELADRLGI